MVAYINIDKLCWEMEQLYNQERDIEKTKEIMREAFEQCLTDNQEDIIKSVEDADKEVSEMEEEDEEEMRCCVMCKSQYDYTNRIKGNSCPECDVSFDDLCDDCISYCGKCEIEICSDCYAKHHNDCEEGKENTKPKTRTAYFYGLFDVNGEQIDQTSLDEMNENLAWEIMVKDEGRVECKHLSVSFIEEVEEAEE